MNVFGMIPSSQGNSSALFFVPLIQPLEMDTLPILQPAGREEAPVLLVSCLLSVLSSLTVTDTLWHNRPHDPGVHQW